MDFSSGFQSTVSSSGEGSRSGHVNAAKGSCLPGGHSCRGGLLTGSPHDPGIESSAASCVARPWQRVYRKLSIGPKGLERNTLEDGPLVQVLVRDNNVDQALRALKKKMQREGIFREMKLRNYFEKPSEKKAREKAEAIRRARKLARKKLQREGLLPMKPKPVFGAGPGAERGGAGGRGGPGAGPRGPR